MHEVGGRYPIVQFAQANLELVDEFVQARIGQLGDFGRVQASLERVDGGQRSRVLGPVSYTHLDVYKRQAQGLEAGGARIAMSQPVRAQAVFQGLEDSLDLRWVGGAAGADRVLWSSVETGTPLFGRLNLVQPPRLQILGPEENAFLGGMAPAIRDALIGRMLDPRAGAILVCGDPAQAEALRQERCV